MLLIPNFFTFFLNSFMRNFIAIKFFCSPRIHVNSKTFLTFYPSSSRIRISS